MVASRAGEAAPARMEIRDLANAEEEEGAERGRGTYSAWCQGGGWPWACTPARRRAVVGHRRHPASGLAGWNFLLGALLARSGALPLPRMIGQWTGALLDSSG